MKEIAQKLRKNVIRVTEKYVPDVADVIRNIKIERKIQPPI